MEIDSLEYFVSKQIDCINQIITDLEEKRVSAEQIEASLQPPQMLFID